MRINDNYIMKKHSLKNGLAGQAGGVALRVVICAVSLLFLGGAIILLLQMFQSAKEYDHDRAIKMAEEGLQEAFLFRLGELCDGGEVFRDEPYEDGGGYSVAVSREERDGTVFVTVVSTGKSGSISITQTQSVECRPRFEPPEDNGSMWVNESIQ